MLALDLRLSRLYEVDRQCFQPAYAFQLFLVIRLAFNPLLSVQQIPVDCITLVMHPVERIERDVVWSSCAGCAKRQCFVIDGLKPFRRLTVVSQQSRFKTNAGRFVFSTEISREHSWSIKNCYAMKIVRHRFQPE